MYMHALPYCSPYSFLLPSWPVPVGGLTVSACGRYLVLVSARKCYSMSLPLCLPILLCLYLRSHHLCSPIYVLCLYLEAITSCMHACRWSAVHWPCPHCHSVQGSGRLQAGISRNMFRSHVSFLRLSFLISIIMLSPTADCDIFPFCTVAIP